jgi:hypothetical protein
VATSLITSLAILKVNFDRGGSDYIGNFEPLVAETLRSGTAQVVDSSLVQASLRAEFGLDVPQAPIRTLLRRMVSRGYARTLANGKFEVLRDTLAEGDFQEMRDDALRQHRGLVRRLVGFARSSGRTLTQSEAEDALLSYVGANGTALLASVVGSDELPRYDPKTVSLGVVHAFVATVIESDPEGFKALETVVKGSVLHGAVFLPDQGRVNSRFRDLHLYLDTRILLRAMGLAGPIQERPARELLDLSYELGASLHCFDHTVSEIRRVLTAVENSLRYRRTLRASTSEILEYMSSQGATPSDLALRIERLPQTLKSLRVDIRHRPPHQPNIGIDETSLEREFRAASTHGYGEEALRHDVDALTAIHRLRGGEPAMVLEASRALFVTTNQLLISVAKSFFERHYWIGGIPLAFGEQEFATLAWLKKPTAAPDLPTALAIANSYASNSPSRETWLAYLEEIDRLESAGEITEDEYYALRYSLTARSNVAAFSGEGRPVTSTSVKAVLDRVKAELRQELRPEIERGVAEAAEALGRQRVAQAEDQADSAVAAVRRANESIDEERNQRRERLRQLSVRWAQRLLLIPKMAIVLVMFGLGYAALQPTIESWLPGTFLRVDVPDWARLLAALFAVAILVFSCFAAWRGTTLNSMLRGIEIHLSRRIESWLTSNFM